MQFDKVSLFYVAPDATVHVRTTVTANGQSCEIDGVPLIEVDGEVVQLGCIRLTVAALRTLTALVNERMATGNFGLIQAGDYKTADPNTRRETPASCNTPWTMEALTPELVPQAIIRDRFRLWSRIEGGCCLYKVMRTGQEPNGDGGYYSIRGALGALGLPHNWRAASQR